MTETVPEQGEQTEGWDAPERDPEVSYPEYGPLPEARISVNFIPGRPPQITVRAHTAAELTAALNELEEGGTYGAIGVAHASMGAQASIGAGLGPTTQIPGPQGPPAPPAMGAPTPPPFGPNVSVPGAPGYAGPPAPPAQWAPPPAAAAAQASPEYQQHGWYKLTIPFKPQGNNPGKPAFDQVMQQYNFRKGRPTEGGQVSFQKADKSWYCSPEIAGAFPMFSPVPA